MADLGFTSKRVKKKPQTGITSDRYQFLGLDQAEPDLGDPLVGPSSIGVNPAPISGNQYVLIANQNQLGKRYWVPSTNLTTGLIPGAFSVYNNNVPVGLANSFNTFNFVGTGVTVDPVGFTNAEQTGIATIRITVTDLIGPGNVNSIPYKASSGFLAGASDFVYSNTNIGIGSTQPTVKLDVIGNVKVLGIITASSFRGDGSQLTGIGSASSVVLSPNTTSTSTSIVFSQFSSANPTSQLNSNPSLVFNALNTRLGIGSTVPTATLDVSGDVLITGISTLGTVQISSGIITATSGIVTYYGDGSNLQGISASSIVGVTSFATNAGIASTALSVAANSVGLGTDTFGDYVKNISGTANQITVTGGTGEGSAPTLSIPNQVTLPQDLTVLRDVQINRNLNVDGNITIGGTSATLFTETLTVSDAEIVLGFRTDAFSNDVSNDTTANHGGIAVASTEGNPLVRLVAAGIETLPSTYKKILWFKAGTFSGLGTDAWLINYAVGIGSTQFPTGTRLAAGSVQFTENDLAVVRNINASGIITASSFSGNASSAIFATTSGIATNVIGGIASVTQLSVSGVSTFSGITTHTDSLFGTQASFTGVVTALSFRGDGSQLTGVTGTQIVTQDLISTPVFLTFANNTGVTSLGVVTTGSNALSVIPSSGNLGIGTTNPTSKLDVRGNVLISGVSTLGTVEISSGIVTATSGIVTYYGDGSKLQGIVSVAGISVQDESFLVGTSVTTLNFIGAAISVSNAVNGISTVTVVESGIATFATNAGTATSVIGGIGSITELQVTGVSTLGTVQISSGIVTATSGIVTYYGDFIGNVTGTASTASFATTAFSINGFDPSSSVTVRNVATNLLRYPTFVSGTGSTSFVDINTSLFTFIPSNGGRLGIGTTNPTTNLHVIGDGRFIGDVTANNFYGNASSATFATTAGIATNVTGGIASVTQLSVSGVSTLGTVQISSGIVTATSGIVTYYGDGSNLQGISASSIVGVTSFATNAGTATSVIGGIGSITELQVTGVSTLGTVQISSGIVTATSGIVTYYGDGSNLQGVISVAGVSSFATTAGTATSVIGGIGSITELQVTGVSTLGTVEISSGIVTATSGIVTYYGDGSNLQGISASSIVGVTSFATNAGTATSVIGGIASVTQLSVSGISTLGTVQISSGIVTATSGIVTYYGDGSNLQGVISVSGVSSFATNAGTATSVIGGIGSITELQVTGVSTLGTVQISSGIITATSGIVTYYGDGSNLQGISASSIVGVTSFATTAGIASTALSVAINSVGLGTDTFGDYVKEVSGTANQITVTGGTGEGSAPTLSIPNQFTAPQDVTVTRDLQVDRNLNVTGNITIGGTSATLFTETLTVSDAEIVLGFRTDAFSNDVSNDTTANHGGIAVASTEGNPLVRLVVAGIETLPTTYKKILWFKAGTFSGLGTDAWLINYAVGIGSTQFPSGTRLAAGSVQFTENDLAVVRNINASGIITASSFSGNASSATNAGIATNLKGGLAGNVPYQSATDTTAFITNGSSGQVLLFNGSIPVWGNVTSASGAFGGISVQDEGSPVGTANSITTLDFRGNNIVVNATSGVNGIATITVADYVSNAGIATFATTAGIATFTSEWILGAVGSSDYTFTGPGFTGAESDPVLYLVRGQQYKFTNTMGAHPFRIQSTPNGSTGTQYNDGITNNDVSNGTLTWNVQFDAPGLLYYQCTAHTGMGGKIYIIDAGIGPDISINTTGIITATDFNSASDAKLKTNIQPIADPLKKITQIQGVSFNWIKDNKPSMGVIADELQKVLPELVGDTDPKTVNYNGLIGALVEAVKELKVENDVLRERLDEVYRKVFE